MRLALAVCVAALALPASAAAAVHFRTPSGNIGCYVDRDFIRCDIGRTATKVPPRPASCELDWGNAFEMTRTRRPRRICHGDTVLGGRRVLAYGETLRFGAFACLSRTAGLACRNAGGHGWFLSRERVRLF